MSIQVGDNFKYLGKKPIDDRMLYSTLSEMVSIPETSLYEGCKAYVIATGKEYQYKSGNTVDLNTGKWRNTETDLSQYYTKSETDNLLSGKVDKVDTMPTANSSNVGKIIQYAGETTQDYTQGYFYKCILDYSVYKIITWSGQTSSSQPYLYAYIRSIVNGEKLYRDEKCELLYPDNRGRQYYISNADVYAGDPRGITARPLGESTTYYDQGFNKSTAEIIELYKWEKINISEDIIDGYYNETDNKFYEDDIYETEIIPETKKIYISLDTDKSYYWDGSEYKLLSGGSGVSDFDELTNRPLESDAIDIDDLDLPMPAKPTEYPILFDESGTEYQVGYYKRASDGKVKPVYRKYVDCGALPNNTDKTVAHGISNLDTICSVNGCGQNIMSSSKDFIPIACFDPASLNWSVGAWGNITTIIIRTKANYSAYNAHIKLEYTKTTDEWKDLP